MKRDDWTVEDFGIRPAGAPDRCFYCKSSQGTQHKHGCVIRVRTVVMTVTIEILRAVPEDWECEDIEFHMNEGRWCANNIIPEIGDQAERTGCLCESFYAQYVREATSEDEARYVYHVANQPS